MKSQHAYLEKQLDSLKAASEPNNDELETLKKLASIISEEDNEIARIIQSSKNLKEKVCKVDICHNTSLKLQVFQVRHLRYILSFLSSEVAYYFYIINSRLWSSRIK